MTTRLRVIVGSRASPLAMAQTEEVLSQLRERFPDIDLSVVPITTTGDKHKEAPLAELERGTFVKEIELALINGEIDIAIHSAKDLPASLPEGLTLAAIGRRQDPRDVQVNRWGLPLAKLPPRARLGTSSPRRVALLKAFRPDLELLPIRGNVGTRLDKVAGGDYDGVILAAAGLVRLGRQAEITEYLSPNLCTPEVGQGTLAVEARAGDTRTTDMLAAIDHRPSRIALEAERAFLGVMGGGCEVPVAAYAQLEGDQLHISAMAALPNGSRVFRTLLSCDAAEAEDAGRRTAVSLLEAGAAKIVGAR